MEGACVSPRVGRALPTYPGLAGSSTESDVKGGPGLIPAWRCGVLKLARPLRKQVPANLLAFERVSFHAAAHHITLTSHFFPAVQQGMRPTFLRGAEGRDQPLDRTG